MKERGRNLGRQPNTRRTPTYPFPQSDRNRIGVVRPSRFLDWWEWGKDQAEAAIAIPIRLHDEDRPEYSQRERTVIGGWPFTVPFERYLDDEWGHSPYRSVMASLFRPSAEYKRMPQSTEYQVLLELLRQPHPEPERARTLMGSPHPKFFEDAAIRALTMVWERAELMRGLAIEINDLSLEIPPPRRKFSLLCPGDCGRPDCEMAKQVANDR